MHICSYFDSLTIFTFNKTYKHVLHITECFPICSFIVNGFSFEIGSFRVSEATAMQRVFLAVTEVNPCI